VKQIEATILGQSYRLGCPEGGEDKLLAAVAAVDREMGAIRDAGKVRARERIAVLAALNLAYQLVERGTAPPASPAPAPATAGPDDERLRGLITRIDAALADDGRLL
jgi:cell division protein ZapA